MVDLLFYRMQDHAECACYIIESNPDTNPVSWRLYFRAHVCGGIFAQEFDRRLRYLFCLWFAGVYSQASTVTNCADCVGNGTR